VIAVDRLLLGGIFDLRTFLGTIRAKGHYLFIEIDKGTYPLYALLRTCDGFLMRASKKKAPQVKHHALAAAPHAGGSPELGAPTLTLTVGQIVEQLGPVAPDAGAMSERIRHWTREGLLLPVNQHHAGTGRHRRYGPDASYEAAILNALATAGLQLVSRPYIQTALSKARAALHEWHQARTAGRKLPVFFLVILHDVTRIGGEPTASIHEGTVKHDRAAEITIVINLSQLFLRVSDYDQIAGPKQRR
jgi:DNA-binding transcriptional MerR regulator